MRPLLPLLALLAVSCGSPIYRAVAPSTPLHVNPVGDADDARRFYLGRRLPAGAAEMPIDRYDAARAHIAAMPAVSAAPARGAIPHLAGTVTAWTSVGPGNVGGRTRSLVVNPSNPSIMYAGATTGGVWKTTNGGQSWAPLWDSFPTLNVGALAIDNSNPDTIYAGTGEWYTGFPGDGIFKTTDGGATWTHLASNATMTSRFEYVNKLVVSPNNSQRLYAATWSGVYVSANGGVYWTQLLTTQTAYYGCQDLVVRPDLTTDTLFASCSGATSTGDYQILRNTTAPSSTWVQVQTQTNMGRASLAIAPSQPTTIYAMAADYDTKSPYNRGLLAVFRSSSGGDPGTWTRQVDNTSSVGLNTLLLSDVRDSTTALCANGGPVAPTSNQGSYDNVIAVDPTNPNTVWAGGVDLFRSDDGGANWGVASLWQAAYTSNQFAHADRHVIVFHPNYDGAGNQTMFLGNDGGLFRTDNARAAVSTGPMGGCFANFQANSSVFWKNLNNSFVATQFYHGLAYPGGAAYMGGAQDNSVSRGTDLAGINAWQFFSTGDGTAVGIDPFDANHVLQSKQRLSLSRAIDGGTFIGATSGITEDPNNFPFVPALAVDPNDGRRVYLGGVTNLWRSQDFAGTWTAAAPVEAGSSVTFIAVNPADPNSLLFGTALGYIYSNSSALTSSGSTAWASARPRIAAVTSLTYDPTDPLIVYASYSNLKSTSTDAHIYKSPDGGITWSASDGAGAASIPDVPTFKVLVNPYNPSTVYVGSDLGIFVSTDGGATWGHDPNAFASLRVEDLAFDRTVNPNWLFAFTYGRGVFRTPLSGAPAPACSYQVSPTSISDSGFGSAVPVQVTAPNGCSWVGIPGALPNIFRVDSPAQGTGSGTAVVYIEPNTGGAARSDTLNIAGVAVTVNQSGVSSFSSATGDTFTAPVTLNIPGIALSSSSSLTTSATDPVHSCTGNADFKTGWWRVTPTVSGTLQILATGRRTDISGNSGIVLTAYPASATAAPAMASELGCATVPQDTAGRIDASIRFPVSAGTPYLVEVSALGAGAAFNSSITLAATMSSSPDVTLSLSPSSASAIPGGNIVQFTANVANAANGNVRWSISPAIGVISPAGIYTPPPSISAPATIAVTATTLAIPQKQAVATLTIAPPGGGGPAPSISAVSNAASGAASIAPNTWVAINGTNLAANTRVWTGADFIAGQMPTALDGVSVTIDGRKAYVFYISPTQVNVLAPLAGKTGPVSVVLTTANGSSAPATVTQNGFAPSFFLFGGKYAAATHANGSLLGPATLYPGSSTPAQRGETIVLYANGFGEAAPGLVPASASQAGVLPSNPTFTIGGLPVAVQFAGVISPGLYQFNVVVPSAAPNGDLPLTVTYMGASGPTGVFVTVGN